MPLIEDLGKGTTTGPNRFYSYSRAPAVNSFAHPGAASGAGAGAGAGGPGGGSGTGAGGGAGPARAKRTTAYTPRVSDTATRQRAIAKRLAELERENYSEGSSGTTRFEIPNMDALLDPALQNSSALDGVTGSGAKKRRSIKGGGQNNKSGSTASTRKILASRKTLLNLQDDDPASARDAAEVLAAAPRYPVRHLCGICGSGGRYLCARCGLRYCSLGCDETHKETRCIKMYS